MAKQELARENPSKRPILNHASPLVLTHSVVVLEISQRGGKSLERLFS